VQIENEFTVSAPADALWAYLLDVEKIAPCMPGAELNETIDDRTWKGTVHAKFGPVSMSFAGTVSMEERDDTAHRVVLRAKGMEQKGKGAANASVTSWLEPGADPRKHDGQDAGGHHLVRRGRADVAGLAPGGLEEADPAVRRLPRGGDGGGGHAGGRRGTGRRGSASGYPLCGRRSPASSAGCSAAARPPDRTQRAACVRIRSSSFRVVRRFRMVSSP
jgi:carbon monoxide dehydrogenase subunit G